MEGARDGVRGPNPYGLARCRCCGMPVAAPRALLERELFHISRCPHCHALHPHPQEMAEYAHTARTALIGAIVLLASLALILFAPLEEVWSHLGRGV